MFRNGDCEEVGRPEGDICGEEGERLDDALTRPKNSTTTNISQLPVFLLQFFAGLFVMSFV